MLLAILRMHGWKKVVFSPDGQMAFRSDDKTVKLWRRDGTSCGLSLSIPTM